MAVSVAALIGLGGWQWAGGDIAVGADTETDVATFPCPAPRVVDGDTLNCGKRRIRLQGIDAPELPGHCRQGRDCVPGDPYASTENLRQLVAGGALRCRQTDIDVYGRTVARCKAGQTDLSCAQIEEGHAVKRYALIYC